MFSHVYYCCIVIVTSHMVLCSSQSSVLIRNGLPGPTDLKCQDRDMQRTLTWQPNNLWKTRGKLFYKVGFCSINGCKFKKIECYNDDARKRVIKHRNTNTTCKLSVAKITPIATLSFRVKAVIHDGNLTIHSNYTYVICTEVVYGTKYSQPEVSLPEIARNRIQIKQKLPVMLRRTLESLTAGFVSNLKIKYQTCYSTKGKTDCGNLPISMYEECVTVSAPSSLNVLKNLAPNTKYCLKIYFHTLYYKTIDSTPVIMEVETKPAQLKQPNMVVNKGPTSLGVTYSTENLTEILGVRSPVIYHSCIVNVEKKQDCPSKKLNYSCRVSDYDSTYFPGLKPLHYYCMMGYYTVHWKTNLTSEIGYWNGTLLADRSSDITTYSSIFGAILFLICLMFVTTMTYRIKQSMNRLKNYELPPHLKHNMGELPVIISEKTEEKFEKIRFYDQDQRDSTPHEEENAGRDPATTEAENEDCVSENTVEQEQEESESLLPSPSSVSEDDYDTQYRDLEMMHDFVHVNMKSNEPADYVKYKANVVRTPANSQNNLDMTPASSQTNVSTPTRSQNNMGMSLASSLTNLGTSTQNNVNLSPASSQCISSSCVNGDLQEGESNLSENLSQDRFTTGENNGFPTQSINDDIPGGSVRTSREDFCIHISGQYCNRENNDNGYDSSASSEFSSEYTDPQSKLLALI